MRAQPQFSKIVEKHLGASLDFDPSIAPLILRQLPSSPAVFALAGADERAQPYIGRTPNLRGRLGRLLIPSARHPRRLQLAGLIRTLYWQPVGSDFEALLCQFNLLEAIHGEKAIERMHLRQPAFIRYWGNNPFPRLTVTHRTTARDTGWFYGPFASRQAAERYSEEVIKLFDLRRCTEDLAPSAEHPGCVYSEMKMCLAPCNLTTPAEEYRKTAQAAEEFLATRGDSKLEELAKARDAASENLEFEQAAMLHGQWHRIDGIRSNAPELVQPLEQLAALVLQGGSEPDEVHLFLFHQGTLRGPAIFSTLGMRIQNENSGSSSLFSHPIAMEPVPEEPSTAPAPVRLAKGALEERLSAALEKLKSTSPEDSASIRLGSLALLKRWYYRPEVKREGEVFFPSPQGEWPTKAILRGIGRVAARQLLGGSAE